MPFIDIEDVRVLVEPEEKYIQIDDIVERDIRRAWECIKSGYPGFTVDFCFHDTLAPIPFLKEIGAEVLEDCITMRLGKEDLIDMPVLKTEEISRENFAAFAALHDEKECDDGFWSSGKIIEDFDNWKILAMFEQGKVTGYVTLRNGWEIYHLTGQSIEDRVSLLAAVVASVAKTTLAAGKEIMFQVDRKDYLNLGAAMHTGFRKIGYYIGYRAVVKQDC